MNDLISRQDAIDEANAWFLDCFKVQKQDRSCGLIRRLEDLPSADAPPVVHGEWIYNKTSQLWECSSCHEEEIRSTSYCPHCGARNRGGR